MHQTTYDRIPVGEVEARRGDHVEATDGPIGRVKGLVVDPSDHHVVNRPPVRSTVFKQTGGGQSGQRRSHPDVELGASPRAGIALIKAARARALIRGRGYVVPDDLYALAPDVILHRIRLNYEALADGKGGDDVLQEILHDLTRGKGHKRALVSN